MRLVFLCLLLTAVFSSKVVEGKPVAFSLSGDAANRIDLIFLGDGYTRGELDKFDADIQKLHDEMFDQQPFREYRNYFNIWRLDVISAESGSDHPELDPPVFRDTAFDSTFNCADIERLVCIDLEKVNAAIADIPAARRDFAVVIVNDDKYGGSGGAVAVATTHSSSLEVLLHELGHSIGLLADEYTKNPPSCTDQIEPVEANATRETARENIKWNAWIDSSTLVPTESTELGVPGLYVGSRYCAKTLYRPTYNSKMRSIGRPFEQINTEQFIRRFYSFVSPLDSFNPTASNLSVPAGERLVFSVTPMVPATHDLEIVWRVDGMTAGNTNTFRLDTWSLSTGIHTVTVSVADTTQLVRIDPDRILTEHHTWTVDIAPPNTWVMDFAHFGNGAIAGRAMSSELVFVNLSTTAIGPTVYFYDQTGEIIPAESLVDVVGNLEVTEDEALTIMTEIATLSELTISTSGRGDGTVGSVRVVADGPIGGILRFDIPGVGVAGVGTGQAVNTAIFPARRQKGGINTGAAIRNLEEEGMVVTCKLMQGGTMLTENHVDLAANGQTAFFINQLFEEVDTDDFEGSVLCSAPEHGMFIGVVLEMDARDRIFTTLPVLPVDPWAKEGQKAVLNFAHFANGGSINSDLVLVNVSATALVPTIYFYDPQGAPIETESVVDLTRDLVLAEDGALSVRTEIPPLGELTVSTHGQGTVTTGSVRVVADGPIGGVLRFNIPAIGVAGVGSSQPVRDALFPARRQKGGINTGAAIRNLGENPIEVSCQLRKEGTVLETADIPLAGNGQTAKFIHELFTQTDTSAFVGSVRCTAPEGERFAGVALEMDADSRIFTTLPVVPVP